LSFGKIKTSQDARSAEYGKCRATVMPLLAKISCTDTAVLRSSVAEMKPTSSAPHTLPQPLQKIYIQMMVYSLSLCNEFVMHNSMHVEGNDRHETHIGTNLSEILQTLPLRGLSLSKI
jgi:hypothetical protein